MCIILLTKYPVLPQHAHEIPRKIISMFVIYSIIILLLLLFTVGTVRRYVYYKYMYSTAVNNTIYYEIFDNLSSQMFETVYRTVSLDRSVGPR